MRTINREQLKKDIENMPFNRTSIRDKAIVYYRFGLNGENTHTLEDTGKEFRVTRERIRQIEARVIDKLGGFDKYLIKE